jgi:FSR family fosmidomycin resistance protein-like MFS transporter
MSQNILSRPLRTGIGGGLVLSVLGGISASHLLNDVIQSLVSAIYPLLKETFNLDFGQIGLIATVFQVTASLLQPIAGYLADRRPRPYAMVFGMGFSLCGLLLLAIAPTYAWLLLAAGLVGLGSSVFHPDASRVARLASGGKFGLAQSLFQVGGNSGTAIGPLLAAFVVVPFGRTSVAFFALIPLLGMVVLAVVGRWYAGQLHQAKLRKITRPTVSAPGMPRGKIAMAVTVLLTLIFSKYFYLASINTYYTFYLIGKFHISLETAQLLLFLFLGSVAAGVLTGGPIGDRFGRKFVIWYSILGALPFTLMLPYANLFWSGVLTVPIGLILASGFSGILVYAQELLPGRVGMISGLFFGFAFGMGGIGAAVLGKLADMTSIGVVYQVCAFLPVLGLLTVFLPKLRR